MLVLPQATGVLRPVREVPPPVLVGAVEIETDAGRFTPHGLVALEHPQEATRRPPRAPAKPADVFVLGVYPSALHLRWTRPDGVVVGALAVTDEPEVFWDGADAAQRIAQWKEIVQWRDVWGRIGAAGGNGSSGRVVADKAFDPLGTSPDRTFFSDSLPYYFVTKGEGSQSWRVSRISWESDSTPGRSTALRGRPGSVHALWSGFR